MMGATETALAPAIAADLDDRTIDVIARRRHSRVSSRGALVRRALVLADLLGLVVAFLATLLVYGSSGASDDIALDGEFLLFAATLPAWIAAAKVYGLYSQDEERADHTTLEDLPGVFHLVTIGTFLLMVGTWASTLPNPHVGKLTFFWLLAIGLISAGRSVARTLCRRSPIYTQNTIVVGAGDIGQLVARKLRCHAEYGMNFLGFVDADPREMRPDLDGARVLGGPDVLPDLVRALHVERVVIAFSSERHEDTLQLIATLRDLNVQVDIVPRLFDGVGPRTKIYTLESVPLIGLPTPKPFPFAHQIKRAVDVLGAMAGLLATAPVFAYAAWRISRESSGPVFFRQARVGKDEREFTCLKFRTMVCDVDDSAHRDYISQTMSAAAPVRADGLYKLDRADAVTPFGRLLRRTSLDELPQLINVLRGDMSLVGPRPCLAYETEHFRSHHFERFRVLPGITGLWQVSARARATFGEALDMDVQYARNWSLGLDLWLLLRTPLHIFGRKSTQ